MLDAEKLNVVLKFFQLKIEKTLVSPPENLKNEEEPIKYSYNLYRASSPSELVGFLKCTLNDIDNLEEEQVHLDRVEIIERQQRSVGLGSILLAYFLCDVFNNEKISECLLTGFPINCSFYFKNGFCLPDSTTELSLEDWYSLTIDAKKDQLYEEEKDNISESKDEFFKSKIEGFAFSFQKNQPRAQALLEQSIDAIYLPALSNVTKNFSGIFLNSSNQQGSEVSNSNSQGTKRKFDDTNTNHNDNTKQLNN
jgi:hypothetical protein